jgi:hypothetical protein
MKEKSRDSERVKEQIGEEAVEFDHDSGRDGEPDRSKDRSGGEKFFHGFQQRLPGVEEADFSGVKR